MASPAQAPLFPLPSVPVGGWLSLFMDLSRNMTRYLYVLQLLQHGLQLSFVPQQPLTTSLMHFLLPEAGSKRERLKTEILSILENWAIERVANKSLPGFYSMLVVISKKTWESSLVIDLQSLNHDLANEKFHMELPANLRPSIQKGDSVVSVDLTDAYLHFLIHPSSKKFLSFLYLSVVFQFRVLPFLHLCSGCHDGPWSTNGSS